MGERPPINRSSVRLLFGYEGREVQLLRKQWLDMVAPASDPIPKEGQEREARAGFWVDLLDSEGRVLYRQVLGENPIAFAVSVYTGDEARPFEMQKLAEPRGEFIILVPDLPAAETVALHGSPPEEEGFTAAAEEIARFALKDSSEGVDR
jgi:hypothetical protein